MCEKGFLVPMVMEEPKERLEIKKLARREKTKKMRMVCLGFTGSPSKNIIVVAEFVSKHGHPSLNGTNPNDASTELPRVDDGLIGWNKLVQQDGNHGPFVN
jgi:hypothetical protein